MSQDAEHLADPRLVSTDDVESSMAAIIFDALLDVRNSTLERLQAEYGDTPVAGVSNFDTIARNRANVAIGENNVRRRIRPEMESVVEQTFETLGSDNHSPQIERTPSFQDQEHARFVTDSVVADTRSAGDDMLDLMRTQVRNAALAGDTMDGVVERVRNRYDEAELRQRARLIAAMNVQDAINTVKLGAYENSPDVDGVRIVNPCTTNTTRLCEHLAGCRLPRRDSENPDRDGDPSKQDLRSQEAAIAWFDEGDLAEQISEQVRDDLLLDGFDPLPMVPPYHFGCRSEIVPAVRE